MSLSSQAPQWQADLFAAVLQVASEVNAVSERSVLLQLLSQLRPDQPQIAAAQAWVMLQQGDAAGARATLDQIDHRQPDLPIIKALLAYCLYVQRDGLWEAYAREALALPRNEAAIEVIRVIAAASKVHLEGLDDDARGAQSLGLIPPTGLSC